MSSEVPNSPRRVMLWCTPRCLSTAFMRGMSNVEDFQVWYEPYLMAQKVPMFDESPPPENSDLSNVPKHFYSMKEECNTYDLVKQKLERDFPGKRLVFVKEMVEGIHGHYDKLPRGYQHIFIIRHPLKTFLSLKKMYVCWSLTDDLGKLPDGIFPSGFFYKEMAEFVEHIMTEYDPNPMIIDADDLQSDKIAVLKEFCKKIGIPYDERIVHWQGDVVFDNWMMAREVMTTFTMTEIHKNAFFGSSGISDVTPLPSRSDLPADVLKLADASMTYYKTLYAQKLVV